MPFSASQFFTAVAASSEAEPSRLWPQPWPMPSPGSGLGSATPASWLRPGLAHDGGGNAGEVGGDAEAFLFEHLGVLGAGLIFVVGDFRHIPDAVAQGDVVLALGVDQPPDLFLILHNVAPIRNGGEEGGT